MKLVVRYALSISLLLAAFALTLILTLAITFNSAFNELITTSEQTNQAQLEQQNTLHLIHVAQQLGRNIQNALYFYDIEAIEQLIEISQAHPDIQEVVVLDNDKTVLHDGSDDNHGFGSTPFDIAMLDTLTVEKPFIKADDDSVKVFLATSIEGVNTGFIVLTGSTTNTRSLLNEQNNSLRQYAQKVIENSLVNTSLVSIAMIILGLCVASIIARNLTHPINALVKLATDIGEGKLSSRVSLDREDELAILADSLNDMAQSMEQRNSQIQYQANHDALTTLPNRRAIHEYIDDLLSAPNPKTFAILFIDLDDFKLLNDIYGHSGGDNALRTLALRLEKAGVVIEQQGADKASLARISGDEFLMVIESEGVKNQLDTICQNI